MVMKAGPERITHQDMTYNNATNLQMYFKIECHDKLHTPPVATFVNVIHSAVVASTLSKYPKLVNCHTNCVVRKFLYPVF